MGARALDRLDFDRLVVFWTYRRKDERKTPEMNVSDRVLFSKKEISTKNYRSFEYDAFKVDHALWFWFKNIGKQRKINDFLCFSLILIKNHENS